METGVCAKLHPEWSMWEQFITDMQGQALKLDAMRSSHPIQASARHGRDAVWPPAHHSAHISSHKIFR